VNLNGERSVVELGQDCQRDLVFGLAVFTPVKYCWSLLNQIGAVHEITDVVWTITVADRHLIFPDRAAKSVLVKLGPVINVARLVWPQYPSWWDVISERGLEVVES
jgi:hypothetical protein